MIPYIIVGYSNKKFWNYPYKEPSDIGPLKISNLNYAFVNRNRDKKPSF